MQKNGYSEATIEPIGKRLRNLAKYVDVNNPEMVKEFVASKEWSEGYKENIVNAYNHYAQVHGIKWELPHYLRPDMLKKLPKEENIDRKKTRIAKLKGNKVIVKLNAVALPESALTYIVAHELAQISNKGRTERFWKTVKLVCPDYEEAMKSFSMFHVKQ